MKYYFEAPGNNKHPSVCVCVVGKKNAMKFFISQFIDSYRELLRLGGEKKLYHVPIALFENHSQCNNCIEFGWPDFLLPLAFIFFPH